MRPDIAVPPRQGSLIDDALDRLFDAADIGNDATLRKRALLQLAHDDAGRQRKKHDVCTLIGKRLVVDHIVLQRIRNGLAAPVPSEHEVPRLFQRGGYGCTDDSETVHDDFHNYPPF